MSSQEFVPFRRKPAWFKLVFVILWLTTIVSLSVFGGSIGYGFLTLTDTTWLAVPAAWVCLPTAITLVLLLKFKG